MKAISALPKVVAGLRRGLALELGDKTCHALESWWNSGSQARSHTVRPLQKLREPECWLVAPLLQHVEPTSAQQPEARWHADESPGMPNPERLLRPRCLGWPASSCRFCLFSWARASGPQKWPERSGLAGIPPREAWSARLEHRTSVQKT